MGFEQYPPFPHQSDPQTQGSPSQFRVPDQTDFPPYYPYQPQTNPVTEKKSLWSWYQTRTLKAQIGILCFVIFLGLILVSLIAVVAGAGQGYSTLSGSQPDQTTGGASVVTPTPTPTPIPPGTGDHMNLGSSYHTDSSSVFIIDHPKDRFSAKDQIAYAVSMDQPFNTFQVTLALVHLDQNGASSVVFTDPITLSDTQSNELAGQFLTSDLMGINPPGRYRIQVENSSSVLAHADFTYTG